MAPIKESNKIPTSETLLGIGNKSYEVLSETFHVTKTSHTSIYNIDMSDDSYLQLDGKSYKHLGYQIMIYIDAFGNYIGCWIFFRLDYPQGGDLAPIPDKLYFLNANNDIVLNISGSDAIVYDVIN